MLFMKKHHKVSFSSVFQPENFTWGPKWPLKTCFRGHFFRKGANRYWLVKNSCQMQMSGHQILEKKTIHKGIHDVVNDQGFAMHYRTISNTVVFRCETWRHRERVNAAKQKDGLTSFLMLCALEARIFFQYDFLEEHKVCVNKRYWSST